MSRATCRPANTTRHSRFSNNSEEHQLVSLSLVLPTHIHLQTTLLTSPLTHPVIPHPPAWSVHHRSPPSLRGEYPHRPPMPFPSSSRRLTLGRFTSPTSSPDRDPPLDGQTDLPLLLPINAPLDRKEGCRRPSVLSPQRLPASHDGAATATALPTRRPRRIQRLTTMLRPITRTRTRLSHQFNPQTPTPTPRTSPLRQAPAGA